MIRYQDFDIRIESDTGAGAVVRAETPKGDGAATMRLPADIFERSGRLGMPAASARGDSTITREATIDAQRALTPRAFGTDLFRALFDGDVSARFYESYGDLEDDEGLRLRLHFDLDDENERRLAHLPWEYLYRPDQHKFVCLSRSTPVVRYIDAPRPGDPIELTENLRVLVIISSPKGTHELDLKAEKDAIEKTFAARSDIDVDILDHPTPERLQSRLTFSDYHVMHFMGHGAHDPKTGIGALIFEDEDGDARPYDSAQLGTLLGDECHHMRLVFLNACDTARCSGNQFSEPFGGVAANLVQSGLTAVVAMQFPISDRAAIAFSRRFYQCIAKGISVDQAMSEGRKAIVNEDTASMEWGTPVLFMRARDGHLFRRGGKIAWQKSSLRSVGEGKNATSADGEDDVSNRALLAILAAIAVIVGGIAWITFN